MNCYLRVHNAQLMKLILLDPGHGGMINNVYQTPGKRSPQWIDLPQLFEGVQNREIANILKSKLSAEGIAYVDVVDSNEDVSLQVRVDRANSAYKVTTKNCVYISIHADAAGNGLMDYPATGISVYTSVGQTQSDVLAEKVLDALQTNIGALTKWRFETVDGDKDKESQFYVLAKTKMPAILCELGFMTNRKECELMQTQDWKMRCAQSIFEGIKAYFKAQNILT